MESATHPPGRPAARAACRGLAAGATTVGLLLAGLSAAAPASAAVPAPTAVRVAHAVDGALSMRWNEVDGATGYVLSRSDAVDGEYTEVARTDERTVYATDDVDTTAVHYYRAQAIGADGALSAPSAAAVGTLVGDGVADPEIPEGGLTLDLGDGAVADGATPVDAGTAYDADHRLGFVDPSKVTATDRGGDDALRSDLVTVGDTELVVDLPAGDYTVGVVAGDPEAATDIAITAEQMAKVPATQKPAGEFLETEFDIALVDGQLNLDFAGDAAHLAGLTITPKPSRGAGEKPTVYVTGDSTVQSYTDYWIPQAGWGQMIDGFLSDDVTVDNHAIGGRSSKNFISQGRLDEVLTQIKPGDYLYVQFGHNDNSYGVDDRYAAPADYRNYLRTFVDGAKQRGATPILVTPVSRRSFDASGKANVSFGAYVDEAKALAEETGTPLVDLSASSRALLNELGPEGSKNLFLHTAPGEFADRPDGTADDTHFQANGASHMARLVAEGTRALDIPLADAVSQYRFDFQPAVGTTQAGYASVDERTRYTAAAGYGFRADAGPDGRDRGLAFDPAPTSLQRDFLLPSSDTPFAVDVPDGTYAVSVEWGDPLGVARLGVTVEGTEFAAQESTKGTTSTRELDPVVVTDGRLDVVADGWLNGLTITRVDDTATTISGGDR
ncbi:SGNH/GDSL hydrolase family protein [Isoptericola sp. F-RaC21]|uniref:rhamnogalacturonan acetylesterase n=1 Tax=Isoptericola sp. F-RaC21 TaxID=3141452 RepID=UPI00315C4B18